MKIVVLRKNLKDGLELLVRGASSEGTLPVLKNFLIETIDGRIRVSATNLELAVTAVVPGKIIEEGGITVPLGVVGNILSNLAAERIDIETHEEELTLHTDNYEAKIQGIKKEDFPLIPKIGKKEFEIEVGTNALCDALSLVVIAAQIGGSRPELGGVLFEYQLTAVKFVATDSFRLAEKILQDTRFKSKKEAHWNALIPAKTINEVIRIFRGEESQVQVSFDENQAFFRTERVELISRLLGGAFPEYQQIVPKTAETEIVVSRSELVNALKLTGALADRLHEAYLTIEEKMKCVEIRSLNKAVGENRYLVPAKIKGAPVTLIFNWRFLLEGIKELTAEHLSIGCNGDAKPVIIRAAEDASYFYIVMPITH